MAMSNPSNLPIIPGKWYVIDMVAGGPLDPPGLIAGPFETEREAERDRREYNIADDCVVSRCPVKIG